MKDQRHIGIYLPAFKVLRFLFLFFRMPAQSQKVIYVYKYSAASIAFTDNIINVFRRYPINELLISRILILSGSISTSRVTTLATFSRKYLVMVLEYLWIFPFYLFKRTNISPITDHRHHITNIIYA